MAIAADRLSVRVAAGLGAASAATVVASLLAACASTSSGSQAREQPTSVPASASIDASYDWHGLVIAPFGTLLKESPVALHEVLLFSDQPHGTAELAGKDCYALDTEPPRFIGQASDHYLWCFDHDRLQRIETSVRLRSDEAPRTFARACALWLKAATPPPENGNACEGRDGGVAFSARLALVPGETTAQVSMTLSDAVAHESVSEAVRDPSHDDK